MKKSSKEAQAVGKSPVGRVLVVGDPGAGKLSLIERYVEGQFSGNPLAASTAGQSFDHRKQGDRLIIQDSMPLYGRKTNMDNLDRDLKKSPDVVAICIDLSKPFPEGRNPISRWVDNIDPNRSGKSEIQFVVIGTKSDIARPFSEAKLRSYAEALKLPHIACSANNGKFIQEVFNKVKNPVFVQRAAPATSPAQGWVKKNVITIIVSGIEPFLKEIEKKGASPAILTFAAALEKPNFATNIASSINKTGAEQVTAKMVDSQSQFTIKIDAADEDVPDAGRQVEITNKVSNGKTIKEVMSIVTNMMNDCAAVSHRVGEVSRNAETGEVTRADAFKDITIDTTQCEAETKVMVDTVLKRVGFGEHLQERQEQRQEEIYAANAAAHGPK